MKNTLKYLVAALALCGVVAHAAEMPKPRAVDDRERAEILGRLVERFAVPKDDKIEVRAAGAFRFAGGTNFFFIDRSDLGSVLFERPSYGTDLSPLDEKAYGRETLLPRLAKLLPRLAPTSEPAVFAEFLDEFAGSAPVRGGIVPTDPRKYAVLVARTVSYTRQIDGVPVFGSELIAGLDRDGTIGRLRMHWPKIDPALVVEAQKLQRMVASGEWKPPKALLTGGTEILEITAGVGHSAFADPEFRSAAVVRVLARRTTEGLEQPMTSTAISYYDAAGKDILFSAFPEAPGSDPRLKRQ